MLFDGVDVAGLAERVATPFFLYSQRQVAAESDHLELAGLHLHIGSQIAGLAPYAQAVGAALDLIDEVEAELGVTLPCLDVYGGDDDTDHGRLPDATTLGDLLAFYDAGRLHARTDDAVQRALATVSRHPPART